PSTTNLTAFEGLGNSIPALKVTGRELRIFLRKLDKKLVLVWRGKKEELSVIESFVVKKWNLNPCVFVRGHIRGITSSSRGRQLLISIADGICARFGIHSQIKIFD